MISTYTINTLHNLSLDHPYGVYIVQSETSPYLFRVGASGMRAPIWTRLNTHKGGPARDRKNPPNWTELNRPWKLLWVAQLVTTETGVLCDEHYLQGLLAAQYPFVSESGFRAGAGQAREVVRIAEGSCEKLRAIVQVQTEALFKKEPKTAERWIARAV